VKLCVWILLVSGLCVAWNSRVRADEGELISHLEGDWSTACAPQNEGGTRTLILVRGQHLEYFSFFSPQNHCEGKTVLTSHWITRFKLSRVANRGYEIDYLDEKGEIWFSEIAQLTSDGLSLSTDDGIYVPVQ
jgi:hypothetical protein